ncbi:hypothetical protein BH10PSE3_BH10PSE3_42810 [soil metagenome]
MKAWANVPVGDPAARIPVRAANNTNPFNALQNNQRANPSALKPPVFLTHLDAVERAHGQRPMRRRGAIEREALSMVPSA